MRGRVSQMKNTDEPTTQVYDLQLCDQILDGTVVKLSVKYDLDNPTHIAWTVGCRDSLGHYHEMTDLDSYDEVLI